MIPNLFEPVLFQVQALFEPLSFLLWLYHANGMQTILSLTPLCHERMRKHNHHSLDTTEVHK
jgi:hypothetical protein